MAEAQDVRGIRCPMCNSHRLYKDGLRILASGEPVQRWLCRSCNYRFSLPQEPLQKSSRQSLKAQSAIFSRRQVRDCLTEASKNLTSTTETKTVAGEKGQLVEYAWKLKKRGLREETIKLRTYLLNQLVELGVDLNNVDSVETVLATEKFTASKKHQLVCAYRSYTKVFRIAWEPIRTHYESKQPFVPLEAELDALISAASKRTAAYLQTLKDTGARAGEASKITWTDVDEEKRTIAINAPEKGSTSRTVKVTDKTIAMIKAASKKYDPYVFNPNPGTHKAALIALRKKLACTLQNPRFRQIHLHSFRHWKATMEYAKTKSILHVMKLLGHKSVKNTEIYTHLVDFAGEEFYSAVAKNVEEARSLVEQGFTFVCDIDGSKLFSKRK